MIVFEAKNEQDKDNTIPYYSVTWEYTNKNGELRRTGNSWTDKTYAEKIYNKYLALGRNPQATMRYIWGFAF